MIFRRSIITYACILLLIISAFLVSFSTLLTPYALKSWPVIFFSGLISVLLAWRRAGSSPRLAGRLPFLLALLSLLAAGFTQVLAANDLPSGLLPYQALPGQTLIYLAVGGAAAFLLTWLALAEVEGAEGRAALAAAGLYSSVIFFRVSAVPEVGPAYSVLAGFAILALLSLSGDTVHLAAGERTFWRWVAVCAITQAIAAALSPVPNQSLTYVLYMFILLGLAGLVSLVLCSEARLRGAAWFVVVLGAGLPVIFSLIKALNIWVDFGSAAALAYRLHPSEMGGANLLARSLLVAAPFGVSLLYTRLSRGRWARLRLFALVGLQIAILAVILYARSFEGFFAWLVAVLSFVILVYWPGIRAAWSRIAARRPARIGLIGAAIIVVIGLVYGGIRAGYAVNPYSFNGRFGHWIGALQAFAQHPIFGGGPDNEYLYTRYASGVSLFADAPEFIDDPLYMIRYRSGILKVHAHNLILETAAFSGLAGVVAGGGLLLALIGTGFKAWRRSDPRTRLILAACLAGILGELAWGLLDVIRESPPFFSFPIWAVIGVMLAAARLSQPADAPSPRQFQFTQHGRGSLLLLILAILLVLLPSLSANQYSSGFLAFQEHRWQDAVQNFLASSRVNLLSAQDFWMLSKAELEEGHFAQAAAHLDQAIRLKRGFSPYLSQAGWLAWLNGDLGAAQKYFEAALSGDPLEGWTSGLHANLGLLSAYQGESAEAISYFADSFAFHPELAAQPDWVRLQSPEAGIQVFLAPAYTQPAMSEDLQRRIQAHLGMADIAERHFEQPLDGDLLLTLDRVLDKMHTQYLSESSQANPDAHLILAAEAEVARQAGLFASAEKTYREYQALRPDSAYGYRDLGKALIDLGRDGEAETWLTQAIQISPKNLDVLRLLALAQANQGKIGEAEKTLADLAPISSSYSFQFQYFNSEQIQALNQLSRLSGNGELELQTLVWLSRIQAKPDDYLALADAARAQDNQNQAVESCWKAYQALVASWVRPYDGRIWTAATCLAQTAETDAQIINRLKRYQPAFTNQLLQGHIARLRGLSEQSIHHYQQAVELRGDDGAPHYFLGELYASMGKTAEAELEYIRAAELDTRESLPLLSLGRLYEGAENSEGALAAYRSAVERTPSWDEAQLALGNFYLKTGAFDQAGEHFTLARQVSGEFNPARVYDFASNLASASLTENVVEGYIKNGIYDINGERKLSIFMHPVSAASYALILPEIEAGEKLWLDFSTAMLPDSWSQPGDGVNFSITLQYSGQVVEIYSFYLDPKHNSQDRQWRAGQVDLSAYAGREIVLAFQTTGGAAGDLQFDWACWGEPAIRVSR